MLPKPPPRVGQVGFLFLPPYRVQGVSVAGEQTMVQIPELDVAFDIGLCPRIALASPFVALSHGHMDHVAGLPYYFSQRMFQRMGVGTCICHPDLARSVDAMMQSWVDLEHQQTKYQVVPLEPGAEFEIKNKITLRALEVSHTVPALGYAIIERRNKLRAEYHDLPQEKLRELKQQGVEITHQLEIPLVAYTGDTEFGPFLYRDEFVEAPIVITECTFFEEGHRSRAKIGKHLHVEDIAQILEVWKAEAVVIIHASRRTNLGHSRDELRRIVGDEQASRVHFLMDHRMNRARYDAQLREVEAATCAES